MRGDDFYAEQNIDLRLRTVVTEIDVRGREVALGDGSRAAYDRLLLATGAEPVRLTVPGMDLAHVHTLRTLDDSRAILTPVPRQLVTRSSSERVSSVSRWRRHCAHAVYKYMWWHPTRPNERILGTTMGGFVRNLHEEHGVMFPWRIRRGDRRRRVTL